MEKFRLFLLLHVVTLQLEYLLLYLLTYLQGDDMAIILIFNLLDLLNQANLMSYGSDVFKIFLVEGFLLQNIYFFKLTNKGNLGCPRSGML